MRKTTDIIAKSIRLVLSVAFLVSLVSSFADAQAIPSTLGWYQIPNTNYRQQCPPDATFHVNAGNDCFAVVNSWNGGVFDTQRNRLYFWGGGHNDYLGNEVYSLNLNNMTLSRLYDPSTSPNLQGVSGTFTQMSDGKISSRHNYNHNVYIPTLDKVYTFGGATPTNGSFTNDTWFFDPATLQWSKQTITGSLPTADFGMNAQWNPNDNRIYIMDSNNLYRFDPAAATKSYTAIASKSFCAYRTGFLDSTRNYYWVITNSGCGSPQVWKISLTGTGNTWQQVTPTGATSILSPNWIGVEYDPVSDRAVMWDTGNTVYTMNTSTGAITANNLGSTNGPSKSGNQGTMGRWRYSPSLGVFVVVNHPDANAYAFRLTPAGTTTPPVVSDTAAPSTPTGLSASSVSTSQINLAWNPSTDNVGVAGYRIYRAGTQIATSTTASYLNTGLSPSTAYSYTVAAYDAAGNVSSQSISATATTQGVVSAPGSQTLTFSIVSGADDAHQNASEFQSGGTELYFGFWNGANETTGLRFQNFTVPKGATISSATLALHAVADDDSNTTLAKVRGIAADNAPTFSTTNLPAQGPFTTAGVDWSSGPWSGGTTVSSPNLASIIQEVTSRANWASGNSLALAILNNGTAINSDRGFSQFEDGFPATLTVTFTTGTPGVGDSTPPSVAISSPTAGSSTSGTVTITATASDNVGVAGVQFKLDGVNLGAEDTTSPFSQAWDTTTVANGTHSLTAIARDSAGNQSTSAAITVTVNNATSTPPPSGGADADFLARCSAPGVIKCVGFDNASDFTVPSWPNDGPYPPGGSGALTRLTRDTSIKASGAGSARFEVVANTNGENPSGSWVVSYPTVREGQKLYIQFRQRFDSNMLNNKSSFGGGGWKQIIIHSLEAGSCAQLEITMNNYKYRGFPYMYSDCGGQTFDISASNDVIMEYSQPYPPATSGTVGVDYWCRYNLALQNDLSNRCAFYQPNQWMTFYYEIQVGTWGQPNSTIRAWVGYEGQPLKMVINHTAYRINKEAAAPGLNRLTLTNYDTGRCIVSSCSHPTAYTWYDDLIVSTQPIAAPGAASQPPVTQVPSQPTNLTLQ